YASVSIHALCCFNDCFFGNERFWSALVLIIDRGARLMGDGKHITKSLGGDHPDAGAISGNDRVGCNCTAVDEPGELFGGATNTFKSAFNACNHRIIGRGGRGGQFPDGYLTVISTHGHIGESPSGVDCHVKLSIGLAHHLRVTPLSQIRFYCPSDRIVTGVLVTWSISAETPESSGAHAVKQHIRQHNVDGCFENCGRINASSTAEPCGPS